jgi:hypothetical protein
MFKGFPTLSILIRPFFSVDSGADQVSTHHGNYCHTSYAHKDFFLLWTLRLCKAMFLWLEVLLQLTNL